MSLSQPNHAFVVRQHPSAIMDETAHNGAQVKAAVETVGVFSKVALGIFGKTGSMISIGLLKLVRQRVSVKGVLQPALDELAAV